MRSSKAVFFMEKVRPVAQGIRAVPGCRSGLRACLLLLAGVGLLGVSSWAAPAAKGTADKKAAPQAEYVGAETCAGCHEEVAKGFASNPHTKILKQHEGKSVTCESCHGPGSEHVNGGGDTSKIFNPAKASPKDVDAKCLGCHASAHPNFDRSPHAKANVSCIGCHSVHASGKNTEHLLKASQPQLCYQCHTEVKSSFNMPFHHKVNEGLIQCSDCHNTHGTFSANNLKSTADQNAVCTKCHTDTRGPFVHEHAVVKGEGCMACHTPHGSQNARLLNTANVSTLCYQCHTTVAAGTVHGLYHGSTSNQPCTDCHTMIHGSNLSRSFIR